MPGEDCREGSNPHESPLPGSRKGLSPSESPTAPRSRGTVPAWITPAEIQTYRNACRQGWAPAPTNDYQKAIYERMQADKERGPSKPLTITPPAKK